jgi:hypothetical protein
MTTMDKQQDKVLSHSYFLHLQFEQAERPFKACRNRIYFLMKTVIDFVAKQKNK